MKRIRVQESEVRRERSWVEVLPLDPHNPDVRRARTLARDANGTGVATE